LNSVLLDLTLRLLF